MKMPMPTKSLEGESQLEQGEVKVEPNLNKGSDEEPTEFPCTACSAKFVTRMSLIRHMILHEDEEEVVDHQQNSEEECSSSSNSSSVPPPPPSIPEQNLLETILKNGSMLANGSSNGSTGSKTSVNGGENRTSTKRPIPNLKPLPSLVQIKNQVPPPPQPEKSLQCQLCGVWFRKKEDLSRHQSRTHGSAKFTCPYCQRNISRRDHLKRHIKNVHPEFCTATEVGPFVNQGAGRPPKLPRELENGTDEEQPPTKRQKSRKSSNGTTNSSSSSMNDTPILQNFLTEIVNPIRFISESKIESDPESDDADENDSTGMDSQLQFPLDMTDPYKHQIENELFDDAQNEDDFDNDLRDYMAESKPELLPMSMVMKVEESEELEDEDEEPGADEETDYGVPMDEGFPVLPQDNNNGYSENEVENQEDENEEGISEFEESILKPLLGGSAERKFKCELCDAAFMSKINMQRHMDTHSVVRPHKCSVCGKGFLRKEHLSKHLSSVHSGMKYRCQFCRKDISRKDHLLRHIRNCHPQEFMGMSLEMIDSVPQISQVPAVTLSDNPNMRVAALSCDMCSEIFIHVDELMEHQSDFHSDIRKFKCEECPKSFKRKEHLIKHLSTHAPPAPKTYSCSECNEVFPSLAIAHGHLRQVHGQKNPSTQNNKSSSPAPPPLALPCNLCDVTFQQRTHLLQHLKAYHGVANPERRFTDASFSAPITPNLPPPAPRQMISIPKAKPTTTKHFPQGFHSHQNSIGKPQIRSFLGIHAANRKDEGSLGSLMGLINKGSISLSLSKIGK